MSTENEKTVTELFNAWKRLDFIGATELLTDSFTFQADPSVKPIEGKDAVGKEWQSYLKFMASYDFKISQMLSSSNVVMVERVEWIGTKKGKTIELPIVGVPANRRQNQRLARLLGSADGTPAGSVRVKRFTGIEKTSDTARHLRDLRAQAGDVNLRGSLADLDEVIVDLHAQPRIGGTAKGLFEPERHFRSYAALAVDDIVQLLACNAECCGGLRHREAELIKIFAYSSPG